MTMGAIPALLSPPTMKIEQSVKRKGDKKNDKVISQPPHKTFCYSPEKLNYKNWRLE
ncbi:hypothetical protein [Fischerella thermalis]|uniref:hypothetical protein n=1 Tax=Fischerella thermalis TaxID=372787 RepID=UPI0019F7557D|nr:hypothetical protein [Fischerella thermalis]MBF1989310.1 hypothetical protein [Fischerella thermalis M58_A2018_009]